MNISDHDFEFILDYIEKQTGITLPETKYKYVKIFLEAACERLQMDCHAYTQVLGINNGEYAAFIDAITIKETYFFREEKQFALLDDYLIKTICQQNAPLINIWCAASSTGEEAISLSALFTKHKLQGNCQDFRIFATDINPYVLEQFKTGIYTKNSFRSDGAKYKEILNNQGQFEKDGLRLHANNLSGFQIRMLNLFKEEPKQFPDSFQIIFFRNALIYMKPENRLYIIDKLVNRLAEGGYLFLSISETALISHARLLLIEKDNVYFFRKASQPQNIVLGNASEKTDLFVPEEKYRIPRTAVTANDINKVAIAMLTRALGEDEASNHQIRAARDFLAIILHINNSDVSEARNLLKALEERIEPNEVLHYLYGYLDMVSGNTQNAILRFHKAVLLNNSFWIARFYMARLMAANSPNASQREFRLCRKYIQRYLENNDSSLGFLLEGFNVKYFEALCEKYLTNLAHGAGYDY